MKSSTNWLTTIVGLGLCLLSPATVNARIWKDATGKHEIDAEFISLVGDNVELKTSAGKTLKLPLAKLSEADRAIVKELTKTAAPDPVPTAKDGEHQKIAIDGDVADWSPIPLVIEAANSPVVEQEVDVQQLKVGSDDKNLYFYVTTTLPPLTAIEKMSEGGAESIFVIYLDTDGDATTGCENYELHRAKGIKISGFDLMLVVSLGRDAGSLGALRAKDGPFARYDTFAPGKGSFSVIDKKRLKEKYSIYPNSSVALCPMGIELALPLETYKIKPEAKIRMLMHKQGLMEHAVYSEGTYQSANKLAKTAAPDPAPSANKNAEPVRIPSDMKITAEGKLNQGAKFANGEWKDRTSLDIIVTAIDGIAADAYAIGTLTVAPVTVDGAPPLKLKKSMNDHFTAIDRRKEGIFAEHPKNGIKAELNFGEVPPETKSAGPVKGSIKVMAGGTEEAVVIPDLLTQRIGTINDPAIKAAGLRVKLMRKSQGNDIQIGVQLDRESLAAFIALELIDANGVKVNSTEMSMIDDNGEAEFTKTIPKDDVKNASLKFIFRKGGKEMEIPFDIPDVKISK